MAFVLPRQLQQKLALLLLLSCPFVVAHAAAQIVVQAQRQGDAVQVQARATVKAPHELIWQTLTDYNHLAEFVPGIIKSRVLDRHGNKITVEQIGEAHLWFFTYIIDVVVESTEHQPRTIGIRVLKGNLKQLDGGYQLEPVNGKEGEFLLTWSGVIEPAIPVPVMIAVPLMRASISEQFAGMVREIERRQALRASATQGRPPDD